MRKAGVIEQLDRGLFPLADLPVSQNLDLITVAAKVPAGVMCLVSALAFPQITTQVPHEVHVALARGAEPPRLGHTPMGVFWFTGRSFTEGIETHGVDSVQLRGLAWEQRVTSSPCLPSTRRICLAPAACILMTIPRAPPYRRSHSSHSRLG